MKDIIWWIIYKFELTNWFSSYLTLNYTHNNEFGIYSNKYNTNHDNKKSGINEI